MLRLQNHNLHDNRLRSSSLRRTQPLVKAAFCAISTTVPLYCLLNDPSTQARGVTDYMRCDDAITACMNQQPKNRSPSPSRRTERIVTVETVTNETKTTKRTESKRTGRKTVPLDFCETPKSREASPSRKNSTGKSQLGSKNEQFNSANQHSTNGRKSNSHVPVFDNRQESLSRQTLSTEGGLEQQINREYSTETSSLRPPSPPHRNSNERPRSREASPSRKNLTGEGHPGSKRDGGAAISLLYTANQDTTKKQRSSHNSHVPGSDNKLTDNQTKHHHQESLNRQTLSTEGGLEQQINREYSTETSSRRPPSPPNQTTKETTQDNFDERRSRIFADFVMRQEKLSFEDFEKRLNEQTRQFHDYLGLSPAEAEALRRTAFSDSPKTTTATKEYKTTFGQQFHEETVDGKPVNRQVYTVKSEIERNDDVLDKKKTLVADVSDESGSWKVDEERKEHRDLKNPDGGDQTTLIGKATIENKDGRSEHTVECTPLIQSLKANPDSLTLSIPDFIKDALLSPQSLSPTAPPPEALSDSKESLQPSSFVVTPSVHNRTVQE